jgi:hypothetical protein
MCTVPHLTTLLRQHRRTAVVVSRSKARHWKVAYLVSVDEYVYHDSEHTVVPDSVPTPRRVNKRAITAICGAIP